MVEEWGGETPCIPVSVKTQQSIDGLLKMIPLITDMKELRVNPERAAKGTVIEVRLDKGRGSITTVPVWSGTLHADNIVVAGISVGHMRVMMDGRGNRVQDAESPMPVGITGLGKVPTGGDMLSVVPDKRLVCELVEQRYNDQREEQLRVRVKVTLNSLFD